MPSLHSASPGEIEDPVLPCLKHLIVVDKTANGISPSIEGVKAAMDFRDLLLFDDPSADREMKELMEGLNEHDVVNLHFTRFVASWLTCF